jgi:hypothetical protein
MRYLVISIPIDPNLKVALLAIGQRFDEIADACDRLDIADPVFSKIHFPHYVKITEDKPDPWDIETENLDMPELEVMG